MHHRRIGWHFLSCFLVACTAATVSPPGQPIPSPSPPAPVPIASSSGPWTFNYSAGSVAYGISRSATIESQSDSSPHRELSTNATHESLVLILAGDTIHFTAVIDTFAITAQSTMGVVPQLQLPVELSGSFANDSLTIASDSTSKCNPVNSVLATDLRNLLVPFPTQLVLGNSWRDSVESNGCQGNIPTTARTTRWYTVAGETTYLGSPVVVVLRSDTIQAHGDGAQQQHRVILDASGSGNAVYYLNSKDGQILHLATSEELNLTITTSGKINRFRQSSKQDFNLAR